MKTFKSSNTALNISRSNDFVSCDIIYTDTHAIEFTYATVVLFVENR